MVSEGAHGIFKGRGAMWIGCWSDCGIAARSRVKRQQRLLAEFPVVERGQFHNEIMWVLAIDDWITVCGFSLLEEQRVAAVGDRRWLKTEHRAQCQIAGAKPALHHGHEPVGREEFVAA